MKYKILFMFTFLLTLSANVFAKAIDIPFHITDYGIPMLELKINGTPQVGILDLGSSGGVHLPRRIMDSIPKLKIIGTQKRIDLAGRTATNERFIIEELDMNGMRFTAVSGEELQPWGLSLGDPVDAPDDEDLPVIGLGFFNRHTVTIDYKKGLLRIEDTPVLSGREDESEWIRLPFQLVPEGLKVEVAHGKQRCGMILDTGASLSIIKAQTLATNVETVPADKVDFLPNADLFKGLGLDLVELDLSDNKQPIARFYAALLEDLPPEFEADGLLGRDFFEAFVVKFDLGSNVLMIKQQEK